MNIDLNNPNINSTNRGGIRTSSSGVMSPNEHSADGKAEVKKSTDNVSLSHEAKALGRLEKAVSDSSDVDTARIAAVKAAIADGSYTIDTHKIAGKMLAQDDLFS